MRLGTVVVVSISGLVAAVGVIPGVAGASQSGPSIDTSTGVTRQGQQWQNNIGLGQTTSLSPSSLTQRGGGGGQEDDGPVVDDVVVENELRVVDDARNSQSNQRRPSSRSSSNVSVVPGRTLPPVIAGASLAAFQAVHHDSVFSSSSSQKPHQSSSSKAMEKEEDGGDDTLSYSYSSSSSSSSSSSHSSLSSHYSYSSSLPTSDTPAQPTYDADADADDPHRQRTWTEFTTTSATITDPQSHHQPDDPYHHRTYHNRHSDDDGRPLRYSYRLGIRPGGEEVVPTPPAQQQQYQQDLAMRSAQWQDAQNRTLASASLIALLMFLSYYFKEDGLILFTVLLQAWMFQESSFIVGGDLSSSSSSSSAIITNGQLNKWWWFLSMALLVDGPRLFPWMANKFGAVSYAMVIVNVVAAVTNFQWTQTSKTLAFREYIRQTAVSLLCLSLVVVPSSFWIGTFEEFGQKWLLLPAGLGLADDIIAFLVGMMVDGTRSLSSSSSSSSPSSTITTTTIAPKKTWQGYTAGAVVTMGTTWLALGAIGQKYVPKIAQWCPYTQMDGLVLAAFASIVAPFGTSISTLVKRAYGHKKFGTLVAGRGGLVDLLDNQMLMAPFIYFFLSLYKFRGGSTTPGS